MAASIRHRFFCLGTRINLGHGLAFLDSRHSSANSVDSNEFSLDLTRYKTDKRSNPLFALMDRSFLAVPQFRRNLPVPWFNSMVPRGGRAETS
jgi:hypothetical protein